ncbi:unnamed protein product, partial [Chrysoparadoxa australica]
MNGRYASTAFTTPQRRASLPRHRVPSSVEQKHGISSRSHGKGLFASEGGAEKPQPLTLGDSERRIAQLERSEFDLKMKVFYLEERLGQAGLSGDGKSSEGNPNEAPNSAASMLDRERRYREAQYELVKRKEQIEVLRGEVTRQKSEIDALRAARGDEKSGATRRLQQQIGLLEGRLKQEVAHRELAKEQSSEVIHSLQEELDHLKQKLRKESQALQRATEQLQLGTGEGSQAAMRALEQETAALREEANLAKHSMAEKDREIHSLRRDAIRCQELEARDRGKDMELHKLRAEVRVLQSQLGSQTTAMASQQEALQAIKRSAETVAYVEAEEIARLEARLGQVTAHLSKTQSERDALLKERDMAAADVKAVRERAAVRHKDAEGVERGLREQLQAARDREARSAEKCDRLELQMETLGASQGLGLRLGLGLGSPSTTGLHQTHHGGLSDSLSARLDASRRLSSQSRGDWPLDARRGSALSTGTGDGSYGGQSHLLHSLSSQQHKQGFRPGSSVSPSATSQTPSSPQSSLLLGRHNFTHDQASSSPYLSKVLERCASDLKEAIVKELRDTSSMVIVDRKAARGEQSLDVQEHVPRDPATTGSNDGASQELSNPSLNEGEGAKTHGNELEADPILTEAPDLRRLS